MTNKELVIKELMKQWKDFKKPQNLKIWIQKKSKWSRLNFIKWWGGEGEEEEEENFE